MNGLSWSVLAIILVVCHMTIAAPSSMRVKREDELSLDPVSTDVSKDSRNELIEIKEFLHRATTINLLAK